MTERNPAQITRITDEGGSAIAAAALRPLVVDFNPESLGIVIRNQTEAGRQQRGARGRPVQLVSSSEVTLSVMLLFDSTMDGSDVRARTGTIAEMMRPGTVVPNQDGKRHPAKVRFEWASFVFEGMITDYNETVDFFSAEGVPLRASLNLSITHYGPAFPPAGSDRADTGAGTVPATAPVGDGQSVADVAEQHGRPGAERELAEAAGIEDIRNPAVDELPDPAAAAAAGAAAGAFGSPLGGGGVGVGAAGLSFGNPPVAFASGDAGFGLDLGLSAGVSGGISAGVSGGAGVSLAAGASLGGGGAGPGGGMVAGVVAGPGAAPSGGLGIAAFAGLKPPAPVSASARLGGSVSFALPDAPGLSGGATLGAGIGLGGAVGLSAGAGGGPRGGVMVVDVGRTVDLADIIFRER